MFGSNSIIFVMVSFKFPEVPCHIREYDCIILGVEHPFPIACVGTPTERGGERGRLHVQPRENLKNNSIIARVICSVTCSPSSNVFMQ